MKMKFSTQRRVGKHKEFLSSDLAGVVVLGILFFGLIIVFSVLSPYFLKVNNLLRIGTNMAVIGLMAVVGTPVIIAGALDLSVAAIAGLAGVLVALLSLAGINIWVAAILAVAICGAIGGANGLLVTRLKLNSLIVTLGTMSIITGAALVLTNGLTKPLIEPGFNWLGSGRLAGIPFPLVAMLVFSVVLWWILARTKFGREVYAAGGNADASRLMGVNVERIQLALYIASGAVGALAGIILAAMLGAAAPNAAGQQLLTVIAAIILGGTSLYGGRGSIWGTVLAVLILGTLNNGLTLLDVSSFWQDITRGSVLILAVAFDQIRTRAAGS
ncbi:MAG: ABC transporter permease [Albidovulum sp.]|nr:ABC transporter permease [Albidovulum sp.]